MTNTSATSQILLQILLKKYNINPKRFFVSPPELGSMLMEADAALLIGDPALRVHFRPLKNLFQYDLGKLWKRLTGLPMVYAVWAIRRDFAEKNPGLAREVFSAFHKSMQYSIANVALVSEHAARWEIFEAGELQEYFEGMNFAFGENQQKGLLDYYNLAQQGGFLDVVPALEFFNPS